MIEIEPERKIHEKDLTRLVGGGVIVEDEEKTKYLTFIKNSAATGLLDVSTEASSLIETTEVKWPIRICDESTTITISNKQKIT